MSTTAPTSPIMRAIFFIGGGTLGGVVLQQLINIFSGVPPAVGTILLVTGVGGGFLGGLKELASHFGI